MRAAQWQCALAMVGLLITGPGATELRAQGVEELKQRILELERQTREQVETLKKMIEEQEARRAQERRTEEERERALRALQEQVERQQVSRESFLDREAGRKQGADQERNPLGKDIQGNVYAGDQFKIRLGGSLRLHTQWNDTPVGESVSKALLPDPSLEEGGNNADRDNFRAFAGRTRLNLAIQGPTTHGGRTQGYFEMDFNRQFTSGESGAVNNNPRLRHAFGRWSFNDLLTAGDELILAFGQTGSFADLTADTVDFNTMLAGLGAVHRRNPRIELLGKYPLATNLKLVGELGLERPFFGNDFIGTDLGPGDLSGFPALSGGVGLEAGRIGDDFGIGATQLYVRTTWGEFEERFNSGTQTANFGAQSNFDERTFTNQALHGGIVLDRIGFNRTGRARTLKLVAGGLWTRGDAQHLDASFDRRVIIDDDGSLVPAESAGGFVNPIFYLTETLSLRLAAGTQFALDSDRPVVTGALTNNFFRVNNRQAELSLWWTPGPFTFALAYNHTATTYRQVFTSGGSESRENENNKIEFISWFSF